MKLFSNNPDQVSSFSHIDVELVDPARRMHILSGIAIPALRIDDTDDVHRTTCEVDLGIALPDAQQAVAQVGLASIVNDDSSYIFALDDAFVEIEATTGRVLLFVNLGLSGDKSAIERFGFQVVVVAGIHPTGVTGRVLWERSLFDATSIDQTRLKSLMAVMANTIQEVEAPSGGFPTQRLVPIRSTQPQSLQSDGNDFWVPYALDLLPLDTPLVISVDLATVYPSDAFAVQIHGPKDIRLRPGHLSEAGVDFRITTSGLR